MYCSFTFCLFLLGIHQLCFVECYASGGLIWSRSLQDFIPIANVSTFEAYRQEILARSREKEIHNFEGKVLKLGYFQENDTVNFYDNDTKVTGAYGEMLNMLAKYSNFTLVTKKVKMLDMLDRRGNLVGGATFMIYQNEIQIIPKIAYIPWYFNIMDLTAPIWVIRYIMYYQPERKTDTNWMFTMFSYKVWLVIILFLLLLSVLGYFMQKLSIKSQDDKSHGHNLEDHLLYTFATLCAQGAVPDTLDRRIKFFGLLKKMFAWLLLIVFSSHLISYMTNRKIQLPFEDIESMIQNTKYNIYMYRGSIAYVQYMAILQELRKTGKYNLTKRVYYSPSQDGLYKIGCSHKRNNVIFDLEDKSFNGGTCELVPIGKSYFPTWVSFGLPKGFPYTRTFDIGIIKMREFGLMDGLKNRWFKSHATNSETLEHTPFSPVNFNQILMILIIFGTGMVTALIIFILENVVYIYKRNQQRIVRGEILTGSRLSEYRQTMKSKNEANVTQKVRFCSKIAKSRETYQGRLSKIFACERE